MGAQSARGFAVSCVVFSTSHLVSVDAAAEDRGAAPPNTVPPAANTAGFPGGAPPATAPVAPASPSPAAASPPNPAPSAPSSAPPPAGAVAPGYAPPSPAASPTTTGPPAYPPPYDYAAQRAAWERSWAAAGWRPEPKRRWYGWQTLIADGASIVLLAVGGASDSSSDSSGAAAAFGSLGYAFGAPIVHAAHGNWGKAGGSFAFRAGSIALLLVGAASCVGDSFSGRDCGGGDVLFVLGALGIPAAIVVDAAVIAREDVAPDDDEARIRIRPWLAKHGRGGGMSLGGSF